MPATPPATVEDMFVLTARGVRTDDGAMTLLGLTPHADSCSFMMCRGNEAAITQMGHDLGGSASGFLLPS